MNKTPLQREIMPAAERGCKLCPSPAFLRYSFRSPDGSKDLFECSGCGFHFIGYLDPEMPPQGPCDIAEAIEDIEYNTERTRANVELLRRHKAGGRLLDIGSGLGGFLIATRTDFDGVGIEIDMRFVRAACARGVAVSTEPIESPFWREQSETFDAMTLWDVIEHVNDPKRVMQAAYELLKPGGVILLDTPNRDGVLYRAGAFVAWVSGGRMGATMALQYSPRPFCHKQIFRRSDIRRLMAGFREVRVVSRTELSLPIEYYLRTHIRSAKVRTWVARLTGVILRSVPLRNKLIASAIK